MSRALETVHDVKMELRMRATGYSTRACHTLLRVDMIYHHALMQCCKKPYLPAVIVPQFLLGKTD